MKKTMMFLGVLSLGLAQAQQYDEKVGINTDTPSATLNVKTKTDSKSPKNLELENQTGTKLLTILNNGKVGFNNDAPQYRLDMIGLDNNYSGNSIALRIFRDSFSAGALDFFRARGTYQNPTTILKNDILGELITRSYTGNKYIHSSRIRSYVSGDVTQNDAPTSIGFEVANTGDYLNRVMTIHHTRNVGIGTDTPTSPLEIYARNTITDFDRERGKKDMILIKNVNNVPYLADSKESKASISGSMTLRPNYRGHSIDFGLIDLQTATRPFMAFSVAPFEGYPSDKDMTVEHMRIMHTGNIGMGTTAPTHKLHIKADENKDPLKLEGLRETTDANAKNLVVVDGVVKVGVATSNANVKLGTGTSKPCNADNAGTINYEEITKDGKKTGVFGFCMKRNDNEYVWAYMVGGTNPFGTSANGANFADGIKD